MGQERPDLWLLTEFSGHHDILSPQISPAHNILLSQSCIMAQNIIFSCMCIAGQDYE